MISRRYLLGLAAISAISAPAHAQDAGKALAEKFGALEQVQSIAMSPDGDKILFLAPLRAGGVGVFVADMLVGGVPRRILNAANKGERLTWCNWASNTRLVCNVDIIFNDAGQLLGFSRKFAMDSDGKKIALISAGDNSRSLGIVQNGGTIVDWNVPGKPGTVLITRNYVPESTLGTRMASTEDGYGVNELNTETMRVRMVERPNREAIGYISDGRGIVRIMATRGMSGSGYEKDRTKYLYRMRDSRDWKSLSKVEFNANGTTSGFDPVAVDSDKDVVFGFDDNEGYAALYSVKLDGSETKSLVLAKPGADIDGLVTIGINRRVIGASYAEEYRHVEFFDAGLAKLQAALEKALPNAPAVTIIDSSSDESRLLVFASGDSDPGVYYRLDRKTNRMEQVLLSRPELEGLTLGTMKPVTFPAKDGTMIPAYLTLPPGSTGKNLPAIVMPHGGPASRDEWGFDWLVQFCVARGFAVIQPNYRGSAGFGSKWFEKNGFQSWRIAIGDVNDAGRWMVKEGIAAPDKLAIVGWSYGGYAALQSSVLDQGLFKAIVAIAPVTDLQRLREESHDFTNYLQVDKFIGSGPHVKEGSPAQNVDRIVAPVMLFHGTRDQNVNVGESRMMNDRLRGAGKQVEYVEFPDLDHSLHDPAARTRLLAESDAFLRKALNLPAD